MKEKGIYFCPTINFLPAWLATYPPTYIPGVHDKYEGETLIEKELARLYDNVNKAYKIGVVITAGSDSFNCDSTPYGVTTIGEIHRFVDKCGMTEMDAIIAGTSNGAKALGCYDVTGSIVKGKSADMLVIDGDPLKCIYDIDVDKMDMIIKEGEKIVRI
jgi:imidazolonepropionase-like amidohydrolase